MADAYADAGRLREAESAAVQASNLPQNIDPALAAQIQRRLREIRAQRSEVRPLPAWGLFLVAVVAALAGALIWGWQRRRTRTTSGATGVPSSS